MHADGQYTEVIEVQVGADVDLWAVFQFNILNLLVLFRFLMGTVSCRPAAVVQAAGRIHDKNDLTP